MSSAGGFLSPIPVPCALYGGDGLWKQGRIRVEVLSRSKHACSINLWYKIKSSALFSSSEGEISSSSARHQDRRPVNLNQPEPGTQGLSFVDAAAKLDRA
ncbi:predicted protein [Histoplasma capsulatum G186AR]|uniref:Uncharacterized protein n=1 Tax=Ajellomyces capsulatus (strain G186AR / H82 / ATCC MYA-2454 / RMSCC 2432) TaxID=447093 RepID=C0NZS7_AJECG|nr:uncharacterized protein HCBG_08657 [Histoplasma capsulatum G186AR]EEH03017.1 predicted protein [Histoplasma capsulatum G186AR]